MLRSNTDAPPPDREPNEFLDSPCNAVGYFSADECRRILELNETLSTLDGGVSYNGVLAQNIRSSKIRWINPSSKTRSTNR